MPTQINSFDVQLFVEQVCSNIKIMYKDPSFTSQKLVVPINDSKIIIDFTNPDLFKIYDHLTGCLLDRCVNLAYVKSTLLQYIYDDFDNNQVVPQ